VAEGPGRRTLLIGHGPLPSPSCTQSTFGPQRTAAFAQALRAAGHDLRVVLVEDDAQQVIPVPSPAAEPWGHTLRIGRSAATRGGRGARLWDGPGPSLVISAGPFAPGALAAAVRGEAPWLADLPGDPFAELQAAEAAQGGPLDPEAAAAARAIAARVLSEADHLFVISEAQRLAAAGQLGLLGRLPASGALVPIDVIPITYPEGTPPTPPPRAPGEPLRLMLGGALNGWQDLGAALGGLGRLLDQGAPIEVHITGGDGGAHAPAQAQRLRAWLADRARDPRVHAHGWLTEAALRQLAARCHAGLSVDGPGLEPELGSRTRALTWTFAGQALISTARCELLREISAADGMITITTNEEAAVAQAIAAALAAPRLAPMVERARALLSRVAAPERALLPLIRSAGAPQRRPPSHAPWAELSARLAAAEAELAAVHQSWTWRALSGPHAALRGWLGRRPGR
jgi:hypothetical protein